jgi:cytochrome c5
MKKIVSIFCLSVFTACVAASKFAPTAEEMPAMQAKVPGITYDEAMQGYKLYTSHCNNCHRLHNPKEFTPTKWNKVLPEMFGKAKISDSTQQQLIRNYLTAKAK